MPRALWTVWALGAIILLSKEGSPDPAPLSCNPAGICDGRSRSFSSIPSGLTAAMRGLDLSNNEITYIGQADLQRCVNLRALMLKSNGISTIQEDAFSSLSHLEHLDLSDNQLSNLSSSWFRPLSSLKILNLLGNPYKTLGETSLFSHLPNLRILRVGNSYTFTGIQRIDFVGLTFLEELEIIASSLQSYEPQSLKSIQNISYLILHMKQPMLLVEIFVDLLSSVESFELRDTDLDMFHFSGLSISETNPVIKKFTFRNVDMTDQSFNDLVKLLSYASELLEVEFDDCTLNGVGDFHVSELEKIKIPGKVETLTIRKLHIPKFYLFYDLSTVYSITERIKKITVENSKVFLVPCSFSQHLKSLEHLDLSENLMVEEYLKNSACEEGWPSLQTLILRQNHLTSLEKTGEVLLTLKNLTNLDVSKNSFHAMPEACQWPQKMKYLNLSSTRIHRVTNCIPRTLEILDVSNNNLDSFSLILPQLKELYISRNKLKILPDASSFPMCVNLRALMLKSNGISTIQEDAFSSLSHLEHLDLSDNQLSNLSSSWFRPLSSLKILNLLGNPYKTLGETSLFSHLPNLRILRVGNSYTFTGIQRIDFVGLTFLEELEIIASSLQSYEPQSLKSIQNISYLILHMKQPMLLVEIFVDLLSSVESFELRDTDLDMFHFSGLSISETNPVIKKFTFRNVDMTDQSFNDLVKLLSYASELLEVEFDDCTLNGVGDFHVSELEKIKIPGKVETLTIRKLHIPKFYLFYDLSTVYSITERIKKITVENSKVFLVPCSFSQHLKSLEHLDLSENLMVEEYLKNSACEEGWPSLQTLILRQNHLTSLEKTGEVLLTLKNLTNLDVSKNSFHAMPEACQWPQKMKYLNLSSTRIHRVTNCIPRTLEILDVSNNNLDSFSLILPQLKELYISRNKLKILPDASSFPMLGVIWQQCLA
uniref:Toll-like receptor 2 n=1 Tax=Spermophilus dauricus TaxID=99837 RepID=A0A8C9QN30_SPEDA